MRKSRIMSQKYKPLLEISMCDPGGIGPEICAKALVSSAIYDYCKLLLVGDAEIVGDVVRFCGLKL